ncbi:DUF4465 domain-containing protein [Bacteroides sp.]
MKKISLLFLLAVTFAFAGCSDDDKNDYVVSFENKLTEAESEFTTTDGTPVGEYGYYQSRFTDRYAVLSFSHYYSGYGFGGGFTYTNKTDVTSSGYKNISAITGKGKYGKVYLTASIGNPATITNMNTEQYAFKGTWVTNTTYAYLAIKDGNDGFGSVRKFKDGDWFKLTAVGYGIDNQKIGSVDFYLADFRDGKTKIVNDWEWLDLGTLSTASYITFEMSSTDNNSFGMVTPSYFCLDGITLTEK